MGFSEKVVIVTGASSGIGAAAAIFFAREGADVVLVGRNETRLQSVAKDISQVGKRPLVIKADVSDDSDAKRIIEETVEKYGKINVLVNNAGFGKYGTILDGTVLEAYDGLMNTNLRAVIHLTMLAAPHLVKAKGNIVNVSSVGGIKNVLTDPSWTAYCVSKAAVDHFTKAAAAELGPSGVRVNAINPGPVETEFLKASSKNATWNDLKGLTTLNRVSTPKEIAEMIGFIAGEKGVGMTGSIVVIDNGYLIKG